MSKRAQKLALKGLVVLEQGSMALGWILSALNVLSGDPTMVKGLFEEGSDEAAGMHIVRLYINGEWKTIVVDDLIPCNPHGVPLSIHASNAMSYWPVILCKALAKVHGSYEALNHGAVEYALRDLTGGVANTISTKRLLDRSHCLSQLWREVFQMTEMGRKISLGAIITDEDPKHSQLPDAKGSGFLPAVAYSIVRLRMIEGERIVLLRT